MIHLRALCANLRTGEFRVPTADEVRAVLACNGHRDAQAMTAAGVPVSAAAAVVPLLDRCWDAVVTVAQRLHRAGEAKRGDVLAALGLTRQTAAMGLAMIRSGAVPRSFSVTPAAG